MEIVEHKNGKRIAEILNEEVRGLIIFQYDKDNEIYGELLLLKNGVERSKKNPEINLKWEIVGGRRGLEEVQNGYKREKLPEDILRGALREVQEETGLRGENIKSCEPLGKISTKYNANEMLSHLFKIIVLSRYEPKLTEKHIGHQWITLDKEIYKYDFEKKDYFLMPSCDITPRTREILMLLKENNKIRMYLPRKIGQYSASHG